MKKVVVLILFFLGILIIPKVNAQERLTYFSFGVQGPIATGMNDYLMGSGIAIGRYPKGKHAGYNLRLEFSKINEQYKIRALRPSIEYRFRFKKRIQPVIGFGLGFAKEKDKFNSDANNYGLYSSIHFGTNWGFTNNFGMRIQYRVDLILTDYPFGGGLWEISLIYFPKFWARN